jgi:hypothetical protein
VIREYVDKLVASYRGIQALWLIGSRGSGAERPDSDWDLLVFADAAILSRLRADEDQRRRCEDLHVGLLVVYDGDNFVEPWGSPEREKHGNLSGWKWRMLSTREAEYRGTKPNADGWVNINRCKARRLWPR